MTAPSTRYASLEPQSVESDHIARRVGYNSLGAADPRPKDAAASRVETSRLRNATVYTIERLAALIREQVGEPTSALLTQVAKAYKLPMPGTYNGVDDINTLELWLGKILRWMRLYHVTGPDRDAERVALLGSFLDGEAARWYTQEVESPTRAHCVWTFEDVIASMYSRFIHRASAQTAASRFMASRYSRSKGIAGFFSELKEQASRMVEQPDKYTSKRLFLSGTPGGVQ
ncbi:hypothetical protein FA95DRAFT_1494228 [Auriscalpium vulgare]|uniref:Uncharacterized protein n=1 Tax=Auriscalpium vulgare TaxID=40419 RepID=A0ACB8RRY9_9AGAM|nr:hypothetical protein FA95DRAFT_1494228 [Auriscalpium vulgare]